MKKIYEITKFRTLEVAIGLVTILILLVGSQPQL